GGKAEPHFSQPVRQIFLMLVALGLVAMGSVVAFPAVAPVFLANPYLNGFILLVFLIGLVACFAQVLTLISCVSWIKGFVTQREGHKRTRAPQLLAPLAALLSTRGARMQLGSSSTRSILDSVATRIDEVREITRYIGGLLIFLGLLGTFYGLATTVPALVDTIRSLTPGEGESVMAVFGRLQSGLESQLSGMGVAFASSLLGLAGSLVIGLLELFASHGQNRFYRELEEWLSTITRVSLSDGEGSQENGAIAAVLDQMAEQMDALQRMFTQSDVSRGVVDQRLAELTDDVRALTKSIDAGQGDALRRVAEAQEALVARLSGGETGEGIDADSRMRLRSIDVQLLRILEEISAGRQEAVAELRGDLTALARSMRTLASGGNGSKPRVKIVKGE
ncbi:MAG: biopolymer transporter ExbB, partial [Pseudomonadota bacterium]